MGRVLSFVSVMSLLSVAGCGGGDESEARSLGTTITQQTLVAAWDVSGTHTKGSTTRGIITFRSDGSFGYDLDVAHSGATSRNGTGDGVWTFDGSSLSLIFDVGAAYQGNAQGVSTRFSMFCDNGWTLNFSSLPEA